MRKILFLFLAAVLFFGLPFSLLAQKSDIETIFQKGKTHYSAYVSSSLMFSPLTERLHLNSALSLGLIINRNSFFGVYRTNTNSLIYGKVLDNQLKDPLIHQFYHSGIEFEYVVNPLHLINFGAGVKMGTGRLVLNPDPDYDRHYNVDDHFLSMIPSLHASINLFEWMKLRFNASYRMIYGINTSIRPWGSANSINYDSKDFCRPEFSISLVVGGLNDKSFSKN